MVQFVYNLKPETTFPSLTVLFLLYTVDPITGHPSTLQGTLAGTCPCATCYINKSNSQENEEAFRPPVRRQLAIVEQDVGHVRADW